jgi:hypothetical protein
MIQKFQSYSATRAGNTCFVAFILVFALVLCTPMLLSAQSLAGLGALTGTVFDPSGAVVPNAAVEVVNANLGIDRKLTATGAGIFFAPSLTPDPGYSVVVTAPGFATTTVTGIVVHVGEEATVPVKMVVSSASSSVTISADTEPIIDTTKTEISTLVSQEQIANLPINGRRADQFVLLTPGVSRDGTNGDVTFHGIPNGNLFLQDGVDITTQWFVADAGGGSSSIAMLSNISMDAVQEFRTEALGYSAEFGRGAGGVVNTLTKSGSDQFHGTAFWYFRNRTLNAIDLFSKLNGVPFNAPEYRHEFGGTVGGPIDKRQKLYFFSSYEGAIRNYPIISSIINSSILSSSGQLLPGVCTAQAAQCAAAQTDINRFFRTVNRSLDQNGAFAKFDYRPSEKSTYTLGMNLVNYSTVHGGVTSIAPTDGSAVGTNYNQATHVRNLHLSDTYLLSGSMVNEARFGFSQDRRQQGLAADLLPPGGLLSAVTVAGQGSFGVSSNQLPNIQPTEKRFDLADDFSMTHGKHQLKYGLDLAYLRSIENAVFNGPGSYTYTSFTNFAYDLDPMPATDPGPAEGKHWSTYAQSLGKPLTSITIRDYDFFAQDQYQLTRALFINLGLRWEYSTFTQPPPPSYAAVNPEYGPINQPKDNFAPRVGFAYSMFNSKTVVRGSYGIFYDRIPGATLTRMQQLGGVVRKSFTLSSNNSTQLAAGPTFPGRLTQLSQVASLGIIANSGFTIPGLKTPYVQEWTFGIEQQLSNNMSFNVAYTGVRGIHFLQRSDINAGPPTGVDTFTIENSSGVPTGQTYSTPVYFNTANGNTTDNTAYGRILQIDNAGRIWYDGLTAEFHQRENRFMQSSIAYTWSHSEDLGQSTATNNYYFSDQGNTFYNGISTINGRSGYSYEKGRSGEDQAQRLVATAIMSPPTKHFQSTWASETVNGWQLAPIFTAASPQFVNSSLTVSTADPRLYQTTPTLSGIGGEAPGGTRVPFLPTDNLPLGHQYQVDARLTKHFAIREGQTLDLTFEAINAFNHMFFTSVNQTAYKSIWNSTTNTGVIEAVAGTGTGTATAGFPDGTNARRALASMRYTF